MFTQGFDPANSPRKIYLGALGGEERRAAAPEISKGASTTGTQHYPTVRLYRPSNTSIPRHTALYYRCMSYFYSAFGLLLCTRASDVNRPSLCSN